MEVFVGTVAKAVVRRPDGMALTIMRSLTDHHRPGDYDLPGGGIEEGEALEVGLIRELNEEIGATVGATVLRLLQAETKRYDATDSGPWAGKGPRDVTSCLYEVRVPQDFEPQLSHEHEGYKWLSIDELTERLSHLHWGRALQICSQNDVL